MKLQLILFVLIVLAQTFDAYSLHYNLKLDENKSETPSPELTPDTYMSPFRRAREKSLSLSFKSNKENKKNEQENDQYQNYKAQKLSAKKILDKNEKTQVKSSAFKPLSMRTLALRNNPMYGSNMNQMSFLNTLSAQNPQVQPTSFVNFGAQFMTQMGRMKVGNNPKRLNNTLREQRIKLLEDESFLRKNSKLSQFIFSKNRDAILMNQIEQMNRENEARLNKINKVKSKQNDFYRKPTKANSFKFVKNEEVKEEVKENHEEGEEEEEESETLRLKQSPRLTTAPVFVQSEQAQAKEVKLSGKITDAVKLEEVKPERVSIKKLAINKPGSLIDWDEMDREEEEFQRTLELKKKLDEAFKEDN
ncbi:unnamed protein product [Brachionus calyciflorus]|uniref:Uncharacterized protein n=1 Tax=Brachionus calyciflorus TaxID=104777 RepID=A0A813U5K6_9BILA|nr:unnamed protein product [Brachionus calyciflorus]